MLTRRQLQIASFALGGLTAGQVGERLGISAQAITQAMWRACAEDKDLAAGRKALLRFWGRCRRAGLWDGTK